MKNIAKKVLVNIVALAICCAAFAVPAENGWDTVTLTNGSTIEVQLMGDEFYHYWATRDGKIAEQEPDGRFVVTAEDVPTLEQRLARRTQSPRLDNQRRALYKYGDLQIPRTLIIIVNFSDLAVQPEHDSVYYNNLMNGETNSAKDYFRQSSDGAYAPSCDVYGPYTLPLPMAYYGENNPDYNNNDKHADQMVVDACALAYEHGCNFAQYDCNSDGYVDNVYVIYAGYSEASHASADAIWPHQWNVYAQNVSGVRTYNGKTIKRYACSAELRSNSGTQCAGIGTFCHEFSHVIGMPDYYITSDGSADNKTLTPNNWSLMDQGSYNGQGKYPPLYSIFDRYFMGWRTPTILNEAENVSMPVGSEYARQITANDQLAAVTCTDTVYYLENRQQQGYDTYLPGHGMVVWKVAYDGTAWSGNKVNNESGILRYTVVPADGKTSNFGRSGSDAFPGTANVKSFTPIAEHNLTQIEENNKVITFKYNGGINGHKVIVNTTNCRLTPRQTSVTNGNSLSATIVPTDNSYKLSSLVIKLGNTTLQENTDYTLNANRTQFTIKGTSITGADAYDLTINVVCTKQSYKYEFYNTGNCATSDMNGLVAFNGKLELTILPAANYSLAYSTCWSAKMGGTILTYGSDFTYNEATGSFVINEVTGDVVICAEASQITYGISLSPGNYGTLSTSPSYRARAGETVTITVTPTNNDYELELLSITALGHSVTIDENNQFIMPPCDITIGAYWRQKNIDPTYHITATHCSKPADGTAKIGETLRLDISAADQYDLDHSACWKITMNGQVLTYDTDFWYSLKGGGTLTIPNVTGDINIEANAFPYVKWYAREGKWSTTLSVNNRLVLPGAANVCPNNTFVGWCATGLYNATTAPTLVSEGDTVTAPTGYYAVFKAYDASINGYTYSTLCISPAYAITLNACGNGRLSTSPANYAYANDKITITATPNEGYTLDTLSVKTAGNNSVAIENNQFTMPNMAVTVSANFVAKVTTGISNGEGAKGKWKKVIENGQVVIIRGNNKYTILGQKIQ